jgi:hypothetical protein
MMEMSAEKRNHFSAPSWEDMTDAHSQDPYGNLMAPLDHCYETVLHASAGPTFDDTDPHFPPAPPLDVAEPYSVEDHGHHEVSSLSLQQEEEDEKPPAVRMTIHHHPEQFVAPSPPAHYHPQQSPLPRHLSHLSTTGATGASRRTTAATPSSNRVVAMHKQPSREEIDACTTTRSEAALYTWYQRYNELVDYQKVHGHCNVPQKYPPNPALGIWYVLDYNVFVYCLICCLDLILFLVCYAG